jgi:osmoprotectant transport system substrate-binding protein
VSDTRPGSTRRIAAALLIALLGACAAPTSSAPDNPRADLVIGTYPFTESRILAHIYAQALEDAGWTVDVAADISSRELMIPALEQGVVDLVAEYEGTLDTFLTGVPPVAGAENDTERDLSERDLIALDRAPVENKNEFVVTRTTARRLNLSTVSDLAEVSHDMILGGPAECPSRQLCLLGLESLYGITFALFRPLDTGGPLTLAALRSGEIDVGVLFTTDPALTDFDLVVLRDDLSLQPAEHITPVMSVASHAAAGSSARAVINAVSARLSTGGVRELNRLVGVVGRDPEQVADEWVERMDL